MTAAVTGLALLAAPSMIAAGVTAEQDAETLRAEADLNKIAPELLEKMRGMHARSSDQLEALVVVGDGSVPMSVASAAGNSAEVAAALQRAARLLQAPVVEAIEDRGDEVVTTFWIKNMLLVKATSATLQALTGSSAVQRIVPNFEVQLSAVEDATNDMDAAGDETTWGIEKIGVDAVHRELGVTGKGVRVAVLDTGVDISHPDLAGKMVTSDPSDPAHPGGWIEFDREGRAVPSEPHDTIWQGAYHGTHVSGTLFGGSSSGTQIGVAPDAELMHALVLPSGSGSLAQIIAGMEWAVDPHDAAGNYVGEPADVVNMSLGAVGHLSEMIEPTRNLYLAGVFPSIAIGNNCGPQRSGSPGNVYEAVGVGATDGSDDIADFSCGEVVDKSDWTNPPSEWPESYVVPDLSAPGAEIYSAEPAGGYRLLSGTSMAAPHVSGTAALMLQVRPDLGVDEALQTLSGTSFFDDRYGPARPNPRYGSGRINAYVAVTEVALSSGIAGTVTDAQTGESIEKAAITRHDNGRTVETDADGRFRLRLPAGRYDLEITRFGYETVMVEDIVVEDDRFSEVGPALVPLPRGQISGTVVYEPTGYTVPGVRVRVDGVPVDMSAETAGDGSYTIQQVPEGDYHVVASLPQLPDPHPADVTVSAGQSSQADFTVSRPFAIERVSVASDGGQGNAYSGPPVLSADGDFVAFYDASSNLVEGDTNGRSDIFVHDRQTGQTERVSVASDGTQSNRNSDGGPALSPDGRYVAFASDAFNLVAGDTNGRQDIFVHDRHTGQTERVSVASGGTQGNNASHWPALSADGRYVAFMSTATNLVEGDTNRQMDIFVHDRQTGETERVSMASDGTPGDRISGAPSMSADGRHVIFYSHATSLVEDDTNGQMDIFVHDRQTGETERVSVASDGTQGDSYSQWSSLSADGRYVAFNSGATNLVEGDTNGQADVFVHDRQTGQTERVSSAPDGAQADGLSTYPALSADAQHVAFYSNATNLVEGDTNERLDVFVRDLRTGVVQRVSVARDGTQADSSSGRSALSADGRWVAFNSVATNLVDGDTNGWSDTFVVDREYEGRDARFALWDLTVSPEHPTWPQDITVSVGIKNIGGATGEHQAVLEVAGEPRGPSTVTLSPDQQTRITWSLGPRDLGGYSVRVGPLTTTFRVNPPEIAWQLPNNRGLGVQLVRASVLEDSKPRLLDQVWLRATPAGDAEDVRGPWQMRAVGRTYMHRIEGLPAGSYTLAIELVHGDSSINVEGPPLDVRWLGQPATAITAWRQAREQS